MDYQLQLGIFSLIFVILGWLVKLALDTNSNKISLEGRIASMETKVEPLWSVICTQIPKMVNVNNSPNMMLKVQDHTITREEMTILENKLDVRMAEREANGQSTIQEMLALVMVEVEKRERGWN